MKILLTISVALLLFIALVGCGSDDEMSNELEMLEGLWVVESVSLDGTIQNQWESTRMEMSAQGKEGLKILCNEQPIRRLLIWPDQSILDLRDHTNDTFLFVRDDGQEIAMEIQDQGVGLFVLLHTPREISYDDECPLDEAYLICQEEGSWVFKLIRDEN